MGGEGADASGVSASGVSASGVGEPLADASPSGAPEEDEAGPEESAAVASTGTAPAPAAPRWLDAETALDLLASPWAGWTPPICAAWAVPCGRRNGPPDNYFRGPPTS